MLIKFINKYVFYDSYGELYEHLTTVDWVSTYDIQEIPSKNFYDFEPQGRPAGGGHPKFKMVDDYYYSFT